MSGSEATAAPFPNVPRRKRFISLATYRKSGAPVATPLWFGWSRNGLYVVTHGTAGKVKRLRNNAAVSIAPCRSQGKLTGDERQGNARFLADAERTRAAKAIAHRYFLPAFVLGLEMRRRGRGAPPVYIEIEDPR